MLLSLLMVMVPHLTRPQRVTAKQVRHTVHFKGFSKKLLRGPPEGYLVSDPCFLLSRSEFAAVPPFAEAGEPYAPRGVPPVARFGLSRAPAPQGLPGGLPGGPPRRAGAALLRLVRSVAGLRRAPAGRGFPPRGGRERSPGVPVRRDVSGPRRLRASSGA